MDQWKSFQTRTKKKKWNKLVNTISNENEVRRLLTRQKTDQQTFLRAKQNRAQLSSASIPNWQKRWILQRNRGSRYSNPVPLRNYGKTAVEAPPEPLTPNKVEAVDKEDNLSRLDFSRMERKARQEQQPTAPTQGQQSPSRPSDATIIPAAE